MCEIFRNGYGWDQLCEGLLLKESYTTIYHSLGIGKLPRKNNSQKVVRIKFQFQMVVIKLPLKQRLGVRVWWRYGKKLELAASLTKRFLITSSTWIINVYIDSHTKQILNVNDFKVTSNFIFKLQWKMNETK